MEDTIEVQSCFIACFPTVAPFTYVQAQQDNLRTVLALFMDFVHTVFLRF